MGEYAGELDSFIAELKIKMPISQKKLDFYNHRKIDSIIIGIKYLQ